MTALFRNTVVILGFAVFVTIASQAQERSLNETLALINSALQAHSYVDSDDNLTVTSLSLVPGGSLLVKTSKTQGDNEVSTIYEVALEDIDLAAISCRTRGGHSDLLMELKGKAETQLRCVQRNIVHEWALPAEHRVPVAFRTDPAVTRDLEGALRMLVRLARLDPRYGT